MALVLLDGEEIQIQSTMQRHIAVAGEDDAFKFTLTAGTLYQFELLQAQFGAGTLGGDTELRLYSTTGSFIDSKTASSLSPAVFSYAPAVSGTYFLVVDPSGPDTGSYTLRTGVVAANPTDRITPVITFSEPAISSTGADTHDDIKIVFSEFIAKGDSSISIRTSTGALVARFDMQNTSRATVQGGTLVIDHDGLQRNTSYKIEFEPGAIKDLSGNSLSSLTSFTFKTEFLTLDGDSENNTYYSGGGHRFNGGAGTDTAAYTQPISAYVLEKTAGNWRISDRLGQTGQDDLISVEMLRFDGRDFDLRGIPLPEAPALGKSESFLFDAVYYQLKYPAAAPSLDQAAAQYFQAGAAAGMQPNGWFDASYYRTRWADLADLDNATLFRHYNLFGVWEGRSGGTRFDQFDGYAYLHANPDVAAYVDAHLGDFLGSRSNGALAHYVIYGGNEGRQAVDLLGQPITMDYVVG